MQGQRGEHQTEAEQVGHDAGVDQRKAGNDQHPAFEPRGLLQGPALESGRQRGDADCGAQRDRGEVRRVSILTGNGGGLFLPEELSRGADGAMTGFAYPEMMVDVCRAHAAGQVDKAHDLFDAYLPLARYEQQPGIGLAVRKHLLAERGVIASSAIRKPGPKLSAADIAKIALLAARQSRRLAQIA